MATAIPNLQEIPLSDSPNQQMTVSLTVDDAPLTLNLSIGFNEMAGYWTMAIADAEGNPLINVVPLLTGSYPAANILEQFGYMNIGSAYVLNLGTSGLDYPDSNTLGSGFILAWGDTPEPIV